MPTEVEIRNAAVARIIEVTNVFTPAPFVIGRDILNVYESGWMNVLRDDNGNGRIHGWTVTQIGAVLIDEQTAEYDLIYDVWQWDQYASGTDAQNSENQSSVEREAVINGFKNSSALVAALSRAKPLEFPIGSIASVENDFRGQVKVSKGLLRVGIIYGCG